VPSAVPQAATHGSAEALYNLGLLHFHAQGTLRAPEAQRFAAGLFQRAASLPGKNRLDAQFMLALSFSHGHAPAEDPTEPTAAPRAADDIEAVRWCERAAIQGHEMAREALPQFKAALRCSCCGATAAPRADDDAATAAQRRRVSSADDAAAAAATAPRRRISSADDAAAAAVATAQHCRRTSSADEAAAAVAAAAAALRAAAAKATKRTPASPNERAPPPVAALTPCLCGTACYCGPKCKRAHAKAHASTCREVRSQDPDGRPVPQKDWFAKFTLETLGRLPAERQGPPEGVALIEQRAAAPCLL